MSAVVPVRPSLERSEKLQPRHLEQMAVVYVRQSSMQQVHRHHESTQIQYGLVAVAEQLGWARERILVIDDEPHVVERHLGQQPLESRPAHGGGG